MRTSNRAMFYDLLFFIIKVVSLSLSPADADESSPGTVDTGASYETVRGSPSIQRENGRGASLLTLLIVCNSNNFNLILYRTWC